MSTPILWDMTDAEVIEELSRIEYHYGIKSDTEGIEPYPLATREDREMALMASALKRILILLSTSTSKPTKTKVKK